MTFNTKAYLTFKKQTKDMLNFMVAIFYAIPSLKLRIKSIKPNQKLLTPRPEYFGHDKSTPEMIRKLTYGYKSKLGSYAILSIFSFFEAYIIDVCNEIFDFHGGYEEFINLSKKTTTKFFISTPNEIKNNRRKLQTYFKPNEINRYEKYTKLLKEKGYIFPSQLYSAYGLINFMQNIINLKAVNIPETLTQALNFDLSEDEIEQFHNIRDIRNKIAHGRKIDYPFTKVMEIHSFFKNLALRINEHIVNNFMVIEKFA